jgi:hypothetical protein
MTHPDVGHDSFICVTCLIHMWHIIHSYVGRDSSIRAVRHDSFIRGTWLISKYRGLCRSIALVPWNMCDMNHSCVWHDSFICVTWLIHMCDMTHSYVWRDSFVRATWIIHVWDMTHHQMQRAMPLNSTGDMTHAYMRHDSLVCGTWLIHTCDMTYPYEKNSLVSNTESVICTHTHPHTPTLTHTHTQRYGVILSIKEFVRIGYYTKQLRCYWVLYSP